MSITSIDDINVESELKGLFGERILVVDGAMGTALEKLNPSGDDFGGEELIGCYEALNLSAPQLVEDVHRSYISAGADIIKTNSFNGLRRTLVEYDLGYQTRKIACTAAEIARKSVKQYAEDRHIFVMGSMGPGTKSITVTGGITFDEVVETYKEVALGLLEGSADILLLETVQDTLNLKAALMGVKAAQLELDRSAPVAVSVTIERGGTMLAGQNIEALYYTLSGFDLLSIGLNCGTGPAMMTDHLRTLAKLSRFPVSFWPNAGLPDEEGNFNEGPEIFKEVIGGFARKGYLNLAGGCCGTTPEHIRAIRESVDGIKPRPLNASGHFPALTGTETTLIDADSSPVFVGERTNTIGSKKFKRLIAKQSWGLAAEVGRGQVRKGAMVLDLCTADPERDEVSDYLNVLKPLLRKVRVPILVDTTDPAVVEAAFNTIGGKPAVNSVNLEDGGERLRLIAALTKEYGAALVCGLIDDDPESGMAVTLERKLEVAEKIYRVLRDEFDIPDADIIFDPLVFPAGTGDPNYVGSARQTVKAIRRIREIYPGCLTILGISNVSFGLPTAGRDVVNSVFLYECAQAGLGMAIVNTERLRRYPTISKKERKLAEDLLFVGDVDSIAAFNDYFGDMAVKADEDEWSELSIEEKVFRAVVEARREGLIENIDSLLWEMSPMSIVNGPLLQGMDEVGRLFGESKLIIAEVLESAEVMKTAVDHLRHFIPGGALPKSKGKIILATVKGDVHDIGKNLVEMIMSNNGFEVIDLGIKVPPETIIEAVREHKPDMIGLSGLLVRSAQQMVNTAADLSAAGVEVPLMVGGAALTQKFALTKIAPAYKGTLLYTSKAMDGLSLGNRIIDPVQLPKLIEEWEKKKSEAQAGKPLPEEKPPAKPRRPVRKAKPKVAVAKPEAEPEVLPSRWIETDVPEPPDLEPHILKELPSEAIFEYINIHMLYGKHLWVEKLDKRLEDPKDVKFIKLQEQVKEVFEEAVWEDILVPQAVYRWFKAWPEGEQIFVENPDGGEPEKFYFPRQRNNGDLCATDWLRPRDLGGDYLNMFVTTTGQDIGYKATQMRKEGRLLASHILQALALEMTEATAEWLHEKLRRDWGIADPPSFMLKDLFKARYRGVRLSFGYPACPVIEDQAGLFRLLKPEQIGVKLMESMMMAPEASVSAVVFHHSEGRYFGTGL